jgi:hypothetical protein
MTVEEGARMRFGHTLAALALLALASGYPDLASRPVDGPKQASSIDVCKVVPAKVVAAVPGVGSSCTETPPEAGPGSTDYVGTWTDRPEIAKEGKTGSGPQTSLEVTIARYTDKGLLKLAVHNLDQGLPGPPTSAHHLGGPAYEAKGAMEVAIHITWKNYVAYVGLTSVKAPPSSPKVLEPLAKALTETL